MITAFAGRMSEPNTSAMSKNVASTMYTAIHGRRLSSASMDSTSIAGVPPTYVVTPSGDSMLRSCLTTSAPPSRSASGADSTVTSPSVG